MIEKSILCYGDSNTYGFDATDGSRFPEDVRWPRVMAQHLGNVAVIEEGCNGRTIHDVSPFGGPLNGTSYFPECIERHNPMDLVIVYLGINDLFMGSGMGASHIARSLESILSISMAGAVKKSGAPSDNLIIIPPPVNPDMNGAAFYGAEIEESRLFSGAFARVARSTGCLSLDAGELIETIQADGVHLDAGNHRALGAAVAAFLQENALP
jgi:lysophospholipase L1-like esterase